MKRICVAVDKSDPVFNLNVFMNSFSNTTMFKVGLEYFVHFGVHDLLTSKHDIFFDLKFFDIPNTVYYAVRSICRIPNLKLITVHASAGRNIISAAVDARNNCNTKGKIICVTKLTSESTTIDEVLFLTEVALESGADGVVCSGHEVSEIRKRFGNNPIVVTPGIRPQWYTMKDDQARICTPRQAFEFGANVIVIGRPITQAQNTQEAMQKIMDEVGM